MQDNIQTETKTPLDLEPQRSALRGVRSGRQERAAHCHISCNTQGPVPDRFVTGSDIPDRMLRALSRKQIKFQLVLCELHSLLAFAEPLLAKGYRLPSPCPPNPRMLNGENKVIHKQLEGPRSTWTTRDVTTKGDLQHRLEETQRTE